MVTQKIIDEAIQNCDEVINSDTCELCKQEHRELKEIVKIAAIPIKYGITPSELENICERIIKKE